MNVPKIYQSPDGTSLAIEQSDGEFVEVGRDHGYGPWVTLGLLEVVPDNWVRLVPSTRASSVEFDEEYGMRYVTVLDEPVHRTTSETSVNVDWSREGNLVGIELLGPDIDPEDKVVDQHGTLLGSEEL